ncbi:MAG: CinA family protein [Promethearchaeota archaeon]
MSTSPDSESELFLEAVQLAANVGSVLRGRQLTIAVAESCTGGLIGHLFTQTPGSSEYFVGGIIAYANSVKQSLLDVPEATLDQYGAVSEPTVLIMAQIVRQVFAADIGLATSGIAGPTGARPEKPVGLVYIAIAQYPDQPITRSHQFDGTRTENKLHFAMAALQLILDNFI